MHGSFVNAGLEPRV